MSTIPPSERPPLSPAEFAILARLAWTGGLATVGDLATRKFRDDEEWNYKTVNVFLARMAEKGWVTSEPDPEKGNRLRWRMCASVGEVVGYLTARLLNDLALLPGPDPRTQVIALLSAEKAPGERRS